MIARRVHCGRVAPLLNISEEARDGCGDRGGKTGFFRDGVSYLG
jgi:hypothetical protein